MKDDLMGLQVMLNLAHSYHLTQCWPTNDKSPHEHFKKAIKEVRATSMLKKISSQHKKQCTKNGAWMQLASAGWRAKGFSTKKQICSEAREKSLAAVKWVAGKTAAAGVKAVFRGSRLAVGTAWARRQEHQRADGSANVSAGKLCSLILCDTAPSAACGVELQHKAST